jgi:hypothetical protein
MNEEKNIYELLIEKSEIEYQTMLKALNHKHENDELVEEIQIPKWEFNQENSTKL